MEGSLGMAAVALATVAVILGLVLLVLYEICTGLGLFRDVRTIVRQMRHVADEPPEPLEDGPSGT